MLRTQVQKQAMYMDTSDTPTALRCETRPKSDSIVAQVSVSAMPFVRVGKTSNVPRSSSNSLCVTPQAAAGLRGSRFVPSQTTTPRAYLATKRVMDIVGAGLALCLLAPVCTLVALFVWAEDRGPIFYRHQRVGQHGKLFPFYKFRSMVPQADRMKAALMQQNEAGGPVFKMRQDPRVTRIGRVLRRFSLDELPQLWSVLTGDMSLVGPRPHLPEEVARYAPEMQTRLTVQPGLICLREVSGRSNLCFERWMETDLDYIRRRSLALDLAILVRVLPAVFKADGAY